MEMPLRRRSWGRAKAGLDAPSILYTSARRGPLDRSAPQRVLPHSSPLFSRSVCLSVRRLTPHVLMSDGDAKVHARVNSEVGTPSEHLIECLLRKGTGSGLSGTGFRSLTVGYLTVS